MSRLRPRTAIALAVAFAVLAAGVSWMAWFGAAGDGVGRLVSIAALAAIAAGFFGGVKRGAATIAAAFTALGVVLGIVDPSATLCAFNCETRPETFFDTALTTWTLGAGMTLLAAFGGALTTAYRRAAAYLAVVSVGLLWLGWMMLLAGTAEAAIIPALGTVWFGMLFTREMLRVERIRHPAGESQP